jgi:hypothetical protein
MLSTMHELGILMPYQDLENQYYVLKISRYYLSMASSSLVGLTSKLVRYLPTYHVA